MFKTLKITLLSLALSSTAFAFAPEHMNQTKLMQLQNKNKLILIDVYAPWCGTCTTQSDIIDDYLKKHPHTKLHIFRVDFDKDKQWVKAFRAPRQSTLILFKGKKQVWFSVGETSPEVIQAELKKATGDQ